MILTPVNNRLTGLNNFKKMWLVASLCRLTQLKYGVMKKLITPNTAMLLILLAVIHFHACNTSDAASHPHKHKSKQAAGHSSVTALQPAAAAGCDTSKWTHVYDPDRLQVLDRCKVVTGTITERNADEDGDEHMLLKLDNGQENLLQKKNYSKKDGCLVVEVVCVNNITRKRAKGACDGYVNNVQLPNVGDHVRVTGSYVIDSHNGWTEIHPASKIEKI